MLFNFEGPGRDLQIGVEYGGVAQLGEHLLCKQGVIGSIPFISTRAGDRHILGLRTNYTV